MRHAHCEKSSCWVSRFPEWVSLLPAEQRERENLRRSSLTVRVATLNVLAGPYGNSKSFPSVPLQHLKRSTRVRRLSSIIRHLIKDEDLQFLCLQEVDREMDWRAMIDKLGFKCVVQKRPTRCDSCLVAWRASDWEEIARRRVDYDSLVADVLSERHRLRRNNVAIFVALRNRQDKQKICIVANTHIFWNPQREDIKLLQSAQLCHQLEAFRTSLEATFATHDIPFILCGDFNSQPLSSPIRLLLGGQANFLPEEPNEEKQAESGDGDRVYPSFILDCTLNKLCRFLRLLGMDAALESSEEQTRRSEGSLEMVVRASSESRILVTSSKTLCQRRACESIQSFCVPTADSPELQLDQICRHFGICPMPQSILTRCVKCNGSIREIQTEEERSALIEMDVIPCLDRVFEEKKDVFACSDCHQPYWWPEGETSISSRALKKAQSLQSRAEAAGKENDLSSLPDVPNLKLALSVVRGEPICQSLCLASAYSSHLTPTNITAGFTGTLDYIFFEPTLMNVLAVSKLPFADSDVVPPYLPNSCWPSDHLCLVAEIGFSCVN